MKGENSWSSIYARRPSLRLSGFNYREEGYYFVTICAHHRRQLFGRVADDEVTLSPIGAIAADVWSQLPDYYGGIHLDLFVVMPNHVHGIISIHESTDDERPAKLSEIIRGFKSMSSRKINVMSDMPGIPVWQRSFLDHIIRNDRDLERIREYTINNPALWDRDRFFSP